MKIRLIYCIVWSVQTFSVLFVMTATPINSKRFQIITKQQLQQQQRQQSTVINHDTIEKGIRRRS